MVSIKIQPTTKTDISEILVLLAQLGRPKPKTKPEKSIFEKRILQYLKDKDKKIFLAVLDSKIVGLVSMIFVPRLNQTKPELYIPELVVLESHRNMGIGKLLIEFCIKVAQEKNCYRIRLESGNKRVAAHKFYQTLGFDQYAKTYKLDLK
ncbi:MAG: GNAT family N-acetyltransferase [Thaumarchaeota archaeon]|nr:GNAT family N-acetyltransferase [Nitrososphaerota archaeon]